MNTHTLTVTWPITNADLPITDLRAEAVDMLRITAATRGWTYTSAPVLHINHGARPTLTATVEVRVNDEQEAAA